VFATSSTLIPQNALTRMSRSRFLRKYLGRPYVLMNIWIWNHLPKSLASRPLVCAYGSHLHSLIQLRATRRQNTGTFFFRNRPELELLIRLLDQKHRGATLNLTVLGCSKGAEVYSISYAIRRARADLKLSLCALDISKDVLEFAEAGIYSRRSQESSGAETLDSPALGGDVATNTFRDQPSSIFERMSSREMEELFDPDEEQVRVKPRFREGIT
jgi:hypothetical protein